MRSSDTVTTRCTNPRVDATSPDPAPPWETGSGLGEPEQQRRIKSSSAVA
jgi:hypothetical protein